MSLLSARLPLCDRWKIGVAVYRLFAHMLAAGEQEYGEADSDQCADDDAQLSVPCPVFSHHHPRQSGLHRANACAGWRFLPCTQRVGMCARYCADDGALPQHRQHRSGARRLLQRQSRLGLKVPSWRADLSHTGTCGVDLAIHQPLSNRQRNIYICPGGAEPSSLTAP